MQTNDTRRGVVPRWTLGERLGKALTYSEVSPADMAARLGVSKNTIGNYIAERTKISRGFILLWAEMTGVDAEWLETGSPPTGVIDGTGTN